ncbi:nickel insertion protein [Clostridium sp. BJN0001]|uniref:nickel insertion protein n=1 Tax=Clostridium sp. BJN0001 TaxID=2930219 RepID=UPI002468203D|nr:nickel insertion protein [Clostridium sp. BJN0001]
MEIEANIDDQSSEQISYAMDLLLNIGAKDVFLAPIMMKKSRMASKLTVLVDPLEKEKFIKAILTHTSTLGIRYNIKQRTIMNRKIINIQTIYGTVKVKLASYGDIKHYDIEYEDCAKLARLHNVPIKNIYFETEKICKKQFKEE